MKIDKNISVPNNGKHPGRPAKYPFSQMQVGDSFLMPPHDGRTPLGILAATQAHKAFGKGNFKTRKEDGGVRIWRTA